MSVAAAAPDRPWLYGIRPRKVIGAEWQTIVQSILQRMFRTAPTGARTARPIDRWLTEFVAWIEANYDETADYLAGRPPRVGVPGIVYDSRNADGGWTWEARLEKASWNEQISIRHVFWSREDRTDFENWLIHRSLLDTKVAEELIDLIQTVTIETPRHEQASVEVARHLLRIAAND